MGKIRVCVFWMYFNLLNPNLKLVSCQKLSITRYQTCWLCLSATVVWSIDPEIAEAGYLLLWTREPFQPELENVSVWSINPEIAVPECPLYCVMLFCALSPHKCWLTSLQTFINLITKLYWLYYRLYQPHYKTLLTILQTFTDLITNFY